MYVKGENLNYVVLWLSLLQTQKDTVHIYNTAVQHFITLLGCTLVLN